LDPVLINNNITDISCGRFHNLILNKTKSAFSFGYNNVKFILILKFGQLGVCCKSEMFIENFLSINILQISTGEYHSLILNDKNEIFSFGSKIFIII
jgi:alpha-tubulin suppressor-like RCC1 family protein